MNTFTLTFAWLLLSATFVSAVAEELPDPTRPPIEIGASSGQSGRGEASGGDAAQRGLQSVIISPNRRAAIINGKTVELGEKYNDAQLTEVTENGVVLSGAQGKQRLLLMFPAVKIKKKKSPSSPQQGDIKINMTEKPATGKAASSAAAQEGK